MYIYICIYIPLPHTKHFYNMNQWVKWVTTPNVRVIYPNSI